jgi:phospholipid transport system substrate-binding protein
MRSAQRAFDRCADAADTSTQRNGSSLRDARSQPMTRFLNLLLAFLLILSNRTVGSEPLAPSRQPVEKLNAALIEVMRDAKRLGYPGRYKKLEPVVKEVFQFETIAQTALGRHWSKLEPSEQQAFMAKLTDLSIATYASQFNAYDGQTFRYDDTEDTKPDRAIVRYTMVVPTGQPVKFDYIVNRDGTKWQIANIVVDGISDLALKKAQYTSIMEREGFDSLLAKLSQKIADYAKK